MFVAPTYVMLIYIHRHTGLPAKVIRDQLMADINEMERLVASQPGMYGRIWYGQGLAFDEAYQILQDVIYFSYRIMHCSCAYHMYM